ncbi:unnamed protein product [Nesidiocoris tenuis]|uniref:Band 7 domain-containing protein n=1 Tax=Nesidiocoris tenuis TaxID=355587 RepID=A0A6H5FY08_9HEMI|nr:unnamed protein product [Nesidiocoris tenuis]
MFWRRTDSFRRCSVNLSIYLIQWTVQCVQNIYQEKYGYVHIKIINYLYICNEKIRLLYQVKIRCTSIAAYSAIGPFPFHPATWVSPASARITPPSNTSRTHSRYCYLTTITWRIWCRCTSMAMAIASSTPSAERSSAVNFSGIPFESVSSSIWPSIWRSTRDVTHQNFPWVTSLIKSSAPQNFMNLFPIMSVLAILLSSFQHMRDFPEPPRKFHQQLGMADHHRRMRARLPTRRREHDRLEEHSRLRPRQSFEAAYHSAGFHGRHESISRLCRPNKLRLIRRDGSTVHQDGDRTNIPIKDNEKRGCPCGFKHWWGGNYHETRPLSIPIVLDWNGIVKKDNIEWFRHENNEDLNTNVYDIATLMIHKHFSDELNNDELQETIAAQILSQTKDIRCFESEAKEQVCREDRTSGLYTSTDHPSGSGVGSSYGVPGSSKSSCFREDFDYSQKDSRDVIQAMTSLLLTVFDICASPWFSVFPENLLASVIRRPFLLRQSTAPTGLLQVKIQGQNEEMLLAACEQFLGKTDAEIQHIALVTLEGHQRAIMGSMTVEEIYKDRKKFSKQVFEVASSDLVNMGITVVSYTLKDIRDEEGYLKSLGMARTAEVKRDARVGEAEARKDARIKEAIAEEQRMASKFINDTEIAQAQRDFELKKAAYDVEVQTKKAEAEMAYELQAAKTRQRIKEEQMQITVVERKQEIAVQEQETQRKEKELMAQVRRPAQAEKYRLEKLAEANRYRLIMEAEAEAESIRLRGEAEAASILAKAKAEAEQMSKKAEAFREYRQAAIVDMLLDALPKMTAEVAAPLSQTKKITMVSSGAGEVGAAKITGEVLDIVTKVPEMVKNVTGVDIMKYNDVTPFRIHEIHSRPFIGVR